jgi:hypothetical protein
MNAGLTAMLLPGPRLKGGKPLDISCPMSEDQSALLAILEQRRRQLQGEIERHTQHLYDSRIDFDSYHNKMTALQKKVAALNLAYYAKLPLDARLLSATATDSPGSKINALVEHVADIWQTTARERSTQLIFCDLPGLPTPWGYSLFQDIFDKLVERGLPRAEVVCVAKASSVGQKHTCFEKAREGTVRVLLGSTESMGIGTRIGNRLVALHHLDVPWLEDGYRRVTQREGRILHCENTHKEVAIYRYMSEGTADACLWEAHDRKTQFIDQLMAGGG